MQSRIHVHALVMIIGETHIQMGAGKMVDDVHTSREFLQQIIIRNISVDRFQVRMSRLVPQQFKVEIDRTDVMPLLKLIVNQMASNESACAGDQNFHKASYLVAVTMTALLVRAGNRLSSLLNAHAMGKRNE